MKKIVVLIYLMIVCLNVFSKQPIDTSNMHPEFLREVLNDTINHKAEILIHEELKSVFDYLLPSIIAILVALIAFMASFLSIKRQIQSSQYIIDQQIQSAKETADLNFRQNVLSSNRKEWIENLRVKISQLTTRMVFIDSEDEDVIKKFEVIVEIATYVELMLNAIDPRDKLLIDLLRKVLDIAPNDDKDSIAILSDVRMEILDQTRLILKSEWERVKKGE